ncbi:hypothetical protein HPP92_022158 [Vanilla planifolia]|uniref:Uncharacterized protein n=1 Tax=Vanilla planifolia TaxID=51239 RepID=A0A835PUU0_VANPL|nr:hypothetical protein HPP92_022158 [Vanilla planifolia]
MTRDAGFPTSLTPSHKQLHLWLVRDNADFKQIRKFPEKLINEHKHRNQEAKEGERSLQIEDESSEKQSSHSVNAQTTVAVTTSYYSQL